MPAEQNLPVPPAAGASLDDWLHYLEAIHPTEIELGLDRVLIVLRRLFRNRPSARIITVAGTNGKGSTVAALEALLLAAGQSVGSYTSPHLERYNERVRINGQDVDDVALVSAFETIEAARGQTSLTYFEFGTLAAFLVMAQAGVSNWVLEVGLGGRLDAVNVLDADLAVITSIDLDHTAWLGNDRNAIGFEKAGILRPGQLAIYADEDPPASVLQQAAAQKVTLLRPGHGYQLQRLGEHWRVSTDVPVRVFELPLDGLPIHSLAAAAVAAGLLELELDDAAVSEVLSAVVLAGRFERLVAAPQIAIAAGRSEKLPAVYADVGHNPHAARWLASRLAAMCKPGQRIFAVYAGLSDKDSAGVVAALAEVVDQWVICGLAVPRGLSAEALAGRLADLPDVSRNAITSMSVDEGLAVAVKQAAPDDMVLVFGSFFTVAEARRIMAVRAPA
ncbi:bifunctional tetrahydrofolate synthase/dihydrofolate synthase [uncultured Marinobacter sp.]|uniref:bifunctional tetrahydrofolate synthase/dihydrofolate synthase n=1 Tax=uncultured Marinobacter sp. TaxID=187379 RepID=UPI0030DABD18